MTFLARPARNKFRDVWKTDLISGFQVFLIALPLCLGIAVASGFPAVAGIVPAIVGGLIVSRLSGSHVTINGPAAGLIVVILSGVDRLGHGDLVAGYKLTLAAIVVAGLIQVVMGFLKLGRYCSLFPISVIHGMLAAIGLIIVIKQLPIVFGTANKSSTLFGAIASLPKALAAFDPLVSIIGVLSLAILFTYRRFKGRFFEIIPGPLVVVTIASLLALTLQIDQSRMIAIPEKVISALAFPDFTQILTYDFLVVTLSIAIIASLESLLSALAVDKIDPLQRKTDLDKDLRANGFGNIVSGLCGGLPMIAEIVRSSANVNSGAKTGWSNFFHGGFLLIAVLIFPWAIRLLPLAALAAILVTVGCRLASPHKFLHTKTIGVDQLFIFTTTVVAVLASDLLIGVGAGILAKLMLHFGRQVPFHDFFQCRFDVKVKDKTHNIFVHSSLIFTNILPLLRVLERIPRDSMLVVDLSSSPFIDHTSLTALDEIRREFASGGGSFSLLENDGHESYAAHPLAARRLKT